MTRAAAQTIAQAKVNLLLRVGELRSDGYHSVSTILQRITLGDEVQAVVAPSGGRSVVCTPDPAAPGGGNIAFRAAELYARESGWPTGFSVTIRKMVPVGGGLGGGSADAAAVLRLFNALAPRPFSDDDLAVLGGSLGSDVPFLLSDAVIAHATGRGEELRNLEALPQRAVTLLAMPFGVSTPAAYRWLDVARTTGAVAPAHTDDLDPSAPLSWEEVARSCWNDFEEVVAAHHPVLGSLLTALRSLPVEFAGMSGSGATLFCVSRDGAPYPVLPTLPAGVSAIRCSTAMRGWDILPL